MEFLDFKIITDIPAVEMFLSFIKALLPIGIAFLLGKLAWNLWINYINQVFLNKIKWTLLEVKLPPEVFKSPQAMELVFLNAFYQTGGTGDWYSKYYLGKLRNYFSLEIVSFGGKIHFFIKTPLFFKNIIEAQIYAQFPQAEIYEVEDYVDILLKEHAKGDIALFGSEFVLTKPDPYPIKTYIDYGLDRAVGSLEENQKIDPMTPMLEFMGSIQPYEQVWIQIIIRGSMKKWADAGKEEIKVIKETHQKAVKDLGAMVLMTKGEQDIITALEKSIGKTGFDCGIRALYITNTKVGKFNPYNVPGMLGSLRQYNSAELNGFKPKNITGFDIDWLQDPRGKRGAKLKKEMLLAYRNRGFFYPPYDSLWVARRKIKREPFVLNTEELATIFHFPGRVLETPTLKRIESRKSEPPTNLPF